MRTFVIRTDENRRRPFYFAGVSQCELFFFFRTQRLHETGAGNGQTVRHRIAPNNRPATDPIESAVSKSNLLAAVLLCAKISSRLSGHAANLENVREVSAKLNRKPPLHR